MVILILGGKKNVKEVIIIVILILLIGRVIYFVLPKQEKVKIGESVSNVVDKMIKMKE